MMMSPLAPRVPALRTAIRTITGPTSEPISLADAREHLRLVATGSPPTHPDDAWLTRTIPAVRENCEKYTGRYFAPRTVEITLNRFPDGIAPLMLPGAPVAGVESVTYTDGDGNAVVADPATAYQVDTYSEPALLYPAFHGIWPTSRLVPNAVRVRYVAGYSLPGDSPQDYPLPASLVTAMLLVLGHLYENREQTAETRWLIEIPWGACYFMNPYRIDWGLA